MAHYSLGAFYYGALVGSEFDAKWSTRLGLRPEVVETMVMGKTLTAAQRESMNQTMEMGKEIWEALGLDYDELERKAVSYFARAFEVSNEDIRQLIVGHLNAIDNLRFSGGEELGPDARKTIRALADRFHVRIAERPE